MTQSPSAVLEPLDEKGLPSPTDDLVKDLRDEAARLIGYGIDRGSQEATISGNLANRAAYALETAAVVYKRAHYMRGYSDGFKDAQSLATSAGKPEMQPPAGETIRSTQDGSMEAMPVTGQSSVGMVSTPTSEAMAVCDAFDVLSLSEAYGGSGATSVSSKALNALETAVKAQRSALSASAPEQPSAGLTPMAGFLLFLKDMRFTGSWDLPTLNRAIEVGETIVSQSPALAAPEQAVKGLEPVAWLPDPIGVNEIRQLVYDSLDLSEELRLECADTVADAIARTFSSPAEALSRTASREGMVLDEGAKGFILWALRKHGYLEPAALLEATLAASPNTGGTA